MDKRLIARIIVINALFQMKLGGINPIDAKMNALSSVDREFLEAVYSDSVKDKNIVTHELANIMRYLEDEEFVKFIDLEIDGVMRHSGQFDEIIKNKSINWKYDRIGNIEKIILKIALFEMLYMDNIPNIVSIDQAVTLAKMFCADDAGKFINGILAVIHKEETDKHGSFSGKQNEDADDGE